MKKRKTDYDAPDISVTQVEVESALCGSVNVANPNDSNGRIENQTVNQAFDPTWDVSNSGSTINGWENTGTATGI